MLVAQDDTLDVSDLIRFGSLALTLLILTGCATALKRDLTCLALLTPASVAAHRELAEAETQWRRALQSSSKRVQALPTSTVSDPPAEDSGRPGVQAPAEPEDGVPASVSSLPLASTRYRAAQARLHPTLETYRLVMERVELRLEEEQILSDVRWILLWSPAIVLYPVIRWNVRSVIWDGVDPDDDADPVNQRCAQRLHQTTKTSAGAASGPFPMAWTR
ncbi:MAG: hypothetical protein ACREI3_04490 [Nitrospirales bacterium]